MGLSIKINGETSIPLGKDTNVREVLLPLLHSSGDKKGRKRGAQENKAEPHSKKKKKA